MHRFLNITHRRSSALPASCSDSKHEQGVSILEFALVAPVLFLLIAGVVDFGLKINTVKQIAAAVRHSARVGASHPRRIINERGENAACTDSKNSSSLENMKCSSTGDNTIFLSDSVTKATLKSACDYVQQSGLKPEDWQANASVTARQEDGIVFQLAQVQILRDSDTKVRGRDCFLCFGQLYELFEDQSESQFVLEEPCI